MMTMSYINHKFFLKFNKVEFFKSIRPGKIKGDSKVRITLITLKPILHLHAWFKKKLLGKVFVLVFNHYCNFLLF